MKKVVTLIATLLMIVSINAQNVGVVASFNAPTPEQDSVLSGLTSLRGAYYIEDLLGDGNSAIAVTNYSYGTVQVFASTGDNQLELKWISPTDISAGGSTPRYVAFGDLDNDGLNEVIVQLAGIGVAIFEWDGVAGSYNFGTQPSQIVNFEALAGASNSGHAEYFEILDVDGDGENELTIALNSSPNENDRYYVISAVGDWITDQPGFSGFTLEADFKRTALTDYKVDGGSPYAMIAADLNGNGKKEILIHNWNLKNIMPITVPSANTYTLPNTTNGNIQLGIDGIDDVALFSGVAADFDANGREEIYLPTYPGLDGDGNTPHKGWLHVIHYAQDEATNEITEENVALVDMSSVTVLDQFGIGYGDLDANGKPNIYIGGGRGANINTAEFQGGDLTDPANWVVSNLFEQEEGTYTKVVNKDSAGVITTTNTYSSEFVSKLFAKNTDFDKDGKQDIIMPYQGTVDSITVLDLTWNGSKYDTVTSKILAPKKWGLKILEADGGSGVELKEMDLITPNDYVLDQNYPNPFNPTTAIRFSLPVNNNITLTIFDALGREVKTLLSGNELQKGSYEITWDGTNNFGKNVSTGMYIYTLQYGNFSKSMKMMLVK